MESPVLSILVFLASTKSGGAEMTGDQNLNGVVDLKIPNQFRTSSFNLKDQDINDAVNLKIPDIFLSSTTTAGTEDEDIYEVVDLKIPEQFLSTNQVDGMLEEPVRASEKGSVEDENISDIVNIKIPTINLSQQSTSVPNDKNKSVFDNPSEQTTTKSRVSTDPSENDIIQPQTPGPSTFEQNPINIRPIVDVKIPDLAFTCPNGITLAFDQVCINYGNLYAFFSCYIMCYHHVSFSRFAMECRTALRQKPALVVKMKPPVMKKV